MSAARAKKKPQEEFNLFDALKMLEKEKGIPVDYMIEKIQTAIAQAIKKDPFNSENSVVEIDPETGRFYVALRKDVVEEVEDPTTQISVEDAAKYQSGITAGSVLEVALDPKKFGRIAAQAAKSSIHQGIREAEKGLLLKEFIIQGLREAESGMVYDEYNSKQHEILTGVVTRIDPRTGNASLRIGTGAEATDAILLAGEQVKGETLIEGQRIKVYVVDVQNTEKGPRLMISRTHPGLVKRLFELDGVKLSFDEAVLDYIVDKAVEFKLGARGLRSICEAIMMDTMFDLPSTDTRKFVVTLPYAKEKIEKANILELKQVG